jgi:hypothetical protein
VLCEAQIRDHTPSGPATFYACPAQYDDMRSKFSCIFRRAHGVAWGWTRFVDLMSMVPIKDN